MTETYQVTGDMARLVSEIGPNHHQREAQGIYAKESLTLADYAHLTSVGMKYPQEIEAEREKDPARRDILLSEARRLRFEAKQHVADAKAERERAAYAATQVAPAPRVEPPVGMRDDMFAIIHNDDASFMDKLKARKTLRDNQIPWPEEELLKHADPYTAADTRSVIAAHEADLLRFAKEIA